MHHGHQCEKKEQKKKQRPASQDRDLKDWKSRRLGRDPSREKLHARYESGKKPKNSIFNSGVERSRPGTRPTCQRSTDTHREKQCILG